MHEARPEVVVERLEEELRPAAEHVRVRAELGVGARDDVLLK